MAGARVVVVSPTQPITGPARCPRWTARSGARAQATGAAASATVTAAAAALFLAEVAAVVTSVVAMCTVAPRMAAPRTVGPVAGCVQILMVTGMVAAVAAEYSSQRDQCGSEEGEIPPRGLCGNQNRQRRLCRFQGGRQRGFPPGGAAAGSTVERGRGSSLKMSIILTTSLRTRRGPSRHLLG